MPDIKDQANRSISLRSSYHHLPLRIHHSPCNRARRRIPDFLFAIFYTDDDRYCTPLLSLWVVASIESTWTSERKEIVMIWLHLIDPNDYHKGNDDRTCSEKSRKASDDTCINPQKKWKVKSSNDDVSWSPLFSSFSSTVSWSTTSPPAGILFLYFRFFHLSSFIIT